MNKEEKTQIFVKKLKIWGKNSGFSLKTQHRNNLRLLTGAPQLLKKSLNYGDIAQIKETTIPQRSLVSAGPYINQ